MSATTAAPVRKPRVCIVCLYAWPLFDPSSRGAFGGSEVRMAAIARGLARRGKFDVHMVIWDRGKGVMRREGITFHPWTDAEPIPVAPAEPTRFKPLRWLRKSFSMGGWRTVAFALPMAGASLYAAVVAAASSLRARLQMAGRVGGHVVDARRLRIFSEVEPDVLVVHGASSVSADGVFWGRESKRPTVLLSGSDHDLKAELKEHPERTSQYGDLGAAIAFSIENATALGVQTETQAQLAKATYGRATAVIKNPFDPAPKFPRAEDPRRVLWVGKADVVKRPEIALDLAARIPDATFHLVLNASDPDIERRCHDRAASMQNVEIVRTVPFEEIERLFARAAVFLNTSAFEGFPNTFLQAAKYELPIVALSVDPAGMLSAGAGVVADGSVERLEEELRRLLRDATARAAYGKRAREYLLEHHDPETILGAYEALIAGVLADSKRM